MSELQSKRLEVKVCGLREPANIAQIASCKPDRMGLIFYAGSSRFVGDWLSPAALAEMAIEAAMIGVFVDQDLDMIVETATRYTLDGVQLHGDESPATCEALRQRLPGCSISKAFGVGPGFALAQLAPYAALCDSFVLDTRSSPSSPVSGGSGRVFDWSVLAEYPAHCDVPFLLAGGLGPHNVEAACAWRDKIPQLIGVDLNSQVEEAPGRKSIAAVTEAIRLVRAFVPGQAIPQPPAFSGS